MSTIGNGPTWSIGSNGSFITYTKYDSQNRFTLASAQFNGSQWVPTLLPNGTNAYGPIGGEDTSSPATISYLAPGSSGSQIVLWREVGSSTEKQIPKAVPPGVQWIKGERAVTYNATAANGKAQVFKYTLDTNLTAQITSESGGTLSAQMWEAPEYNNALLALTLINGKTQIGIYQKVGTKWQRVNVLKPPSVGTYLWSVEPFTYNGKSYLYMVTSTSSNQKSLTVPTEVWIAGVDPAAPFYRKVCNSQQEVRKNPKAFITTQGAYIYFEVISLLAGIYQIYRVDSGLGPPAN